MSRSPALSRTARLCILAALAVLMAATRVHHFGAVPDASWAVFFIGGFYLAGQVRWAFPLLMALAVGVDYAVISSQGQDFFAHYCVSPGYWALLPAHFALWLAGGWLARHRSGTAADALRLAGSVVVGVAACHLFAQGGFYWLSSSVTAPTLAGWAKNYSDWLPSYLAVTAGYVSVAAVLHLGLARLLPAPVSARAN